MIASFGRPCGWLSYPSSAAHERGVDLSDAAARRAMYRMSQGEWKVCFQTEASAEQLARYASSKPLHAFPDEKR